MLLIFRRNDHREDEPITYLGVAEDITKACDAVRADVCERRGFTPEDTLDIDSTMLLGEGYFNDDNGTWLSWHAQEVTVL
jgi:hypothetical protein